MRFTALGILSSVVSSKQQVSEPDACKAVHKFGDTLTNLQKAIGAEIQVEVKEGKEKQEWGAAQKKKSSETLTTMDADLETLRAEKEATIASLNDLEISRKKMVADLDDLRKDADGIRNELRKMKKTYNDAKQVFMDGETKLDNAILNAKLRKKQSKVSIAHPYGTPEKLFLLATTPKEIEITGKETPDDLAATLKEFKKTYEEKTAEFRKELDGKMDLFKMKEEAVSRKEQALQTNGVRIAEQKNKMARATRNTSNAERIKTSTRNFARAAETETGVFTDSVKKRVAARKKLLEAFKKALKAHQAVMGGSLLSMALISDADSLEGETFLQLEMDESTSERDPFTQVKEMISGLIDSLQAMNNKDTGSDEWCKKQQDKNRKSISIVNTEIDRLRAEMLSYQHDAKAQALSAKHATSDVITLKKELHRIASEQIRANGYIERLRNDNKLMRKVVQKAISLTSECYKESFLQASAQGGDQLLKALKEVMDQLLKLKEVDDAEYIRRYDMRNEVVGSTMSQSRETKRRLDEARIQVSTANDQAFQSKRSLRQKEMQLEEVNRFLSGLAQQCGPALAASFEEQQQRRKETIESLKEALKVLDGESFPSLLALK